MSEYVGRTLGDRYEILELIGEGGMAEVYKARHLQLDRFVAVKIMYRFLTKDNEFRSRFEREAHLTARLNHPNVIQVHDFQSVPEQRLYYLVSELIEGPSLARCLLELEEAQQRMPISEVLRVSASLASALGYAHGEGMIHRDIKPDNVLLEYGERVVLTDFGIAKMLGTGQAATKLTMGNSVWGTPAYMAPEQAMGMAGDGRADLYSLGIMMYQMVMGRLPYSADTPIALAIRHIHDNIPSPRMVDPEVPPDLDAIIMHCLEKEPEARYQSADDLLADLEMVGESVPTNSTETLRRPRSYLAPTLVSHPDNTLLTVQLDGDTPKTSRARRKRAFIGFGVTAILPLLLLGIFILNNGGSNQAALRPTDIIPTSTATATRDLSATGTLSAAMTNEAAAAAQLVAFQLTPTVDLAATMTRIARQGIEAGLTQTAIIQLTPTATITPTLNLNSTVAVLIRMTNDAAANQTAAAATRVAQQITLTPTPCTVISSAASIVPVRTGPSLFNYVYGRLAANTRVPAIGTFTDPGSQEVWWQITFDEREGWVAGTTVIASGHCVALPTPTVTPRLPGVRRSPTAQPSRTATSRPTSIPQPPSGGNSGGGGSSSGGGQPIPPTPIPPTPIPPTPIPPTPIPPTPIPPTPIPPTPIPPTSVPPTSVPPTSVPPTDPPPPPTDPPPPPTNPPPPPTDPPPPPPTP